TASAKFNETLANIVKGLQDSGFSKDDYFAQEQPEEELTPNEILQGNLFEEPKAEYITKSDEDFDVSQIAFNPNEEVTLDTITQNYPLLTDITKQSTQQGEQFEEKLKATDIDDDISIFTDVMKTQPKQYSIDPQFQEEIINLKLPQFFI